MQVINFFRKHYKFFIVFLLTSHILMNVETTMTFKYVGFKTNAQKNTIKDTVYIDEILNKENKPKFNKQFAQNVIQISKKIGVVNNVSPTLLLGMYVNEFDGQMAVEEPRSYFLRECTRIKQYSHLQQLEIADWKNWCVGLSNTTYITKEESNKIIMTIEKYNLDNCIKNA